MHLGFAQLTLLTAAYAAKSSIRAKRPMSENNKISLQASLRRVFVILIRMAESLLNYTLLRCVPPKTAFPQRYVYYKESLQRLQALFLFTRNSYNLYVVTPDPVRFYLLLSESAPSLQEK